MLNNDIYKTLRNVAHKYNLPLKYSYDRECYEHFLIEEDRSKSLNLFVEKIYRNRLYVDITFDCLHIEIYGNNKKFCDVAIHAEEKAMSILKYINKHYKECHNYCDFLYNLAIALRRISQK